MRGKYSIFVQSLVWAGLISNALAAIVCVICKDWNTLIQTSVDYGIWVFNYYVHTKVFRTF